MSEAGEELERALHTARVELASVVEALQRGAAPAGGAPNALDAAIESIAAIVAAHGGAVLDARARRECAALLDLFGVARQLADSGIASTHGELAEVRAVRARLWRQRERFERAEARNCDVSA